MSRQVFFAGMGFVWACSSPLPVMPISAFSPTILDYEVTSLTTLVPVTFTVTGQDVTIGDVPAKDGVPCDVTISSLDDATSIAIHAKNADGTPRTYTIHTAPAARPRYDVTTLTSPVPGQIFLTPFQLVGQVGGPTFLYIFCKRRPTSNA